MPTACFFGAAAGIAKVNAVVRHVESILILRRLFVLVFKVFDFEFFRACNGFFRPSVVVYLIDSINEEFGYVPVAFRGEVCIVGKGRRTSVAKFFPMRKLMKGVFVSLEILRIKVKS